MFNILTLLVYTCMIEFAHPYYILVSLLLVALVAWYRLYVYNRPLYSYTLLPVIAPYSQDTTFWQYRLLELLRWLLLFFLCIALGQPRVPELNSKLPVEGIDIMLALDASGSMAEIENSKQSRFHIARDAAKTFIDKRLHDAIGLVFFGRTVIARTPLTQDKRMLKQILQEADIGIVDHSGTAMMRGLLSAINRLKNSEAKTKIIILLSDGLPTPGDVDPEHVLQLAKDLDIRIYTVGIGEFTIDLQAYRFFGQVIPVPIDWSLLKVLAKETDGKFFLAKEAQDIAAIYDTIDQLETSTLDAPQFGIYYEYFYWFILAAIILLVLERFMRAFVWLII